MTIMVVVVVVVVGMVAKVVVVFMVDLYYAAAAAAANTVVYEIFTYTFCVPWPSRVDRNVQPRIGRYLTFVCVVCCLCVCFSSVCATRTTIMSLILSELILRHEGVVRRPTNQLAAGAGGTGDGAAAVPEGTEFLGEASLLKLLSDLVLHLPACATSIHRSGRGLVFWGVGWS